jgi:hypothetical protein
VFRGVEFEEPGSSSSNEFLAPALRGVPLPTALRRAKDPSGVPKTRSAGFAEAASRSCAQGLLLGSARSRATRLSLRRSRMPRVLLSDFVEVRYEVLFECEVDAVGPEETDASSPAGW